MPAPIGTHLIRDALVRSSFVRPCAVELAELVHARPDAWEVHDTLAWRAWCIATFGPLLTLPYPESLLGAPVHLNEEVPDGTIRCWVRDDIVIDLVLAPEPRRPGMSVGVIL